MKGEVRYFRWLDQQIMSALACVAAALYFLVVGVTSISEDPGLAYFDLIVGFGWIVLGIRAARAGAISTRSGLAVRNVFRSVFVPWSDIAGFSVGSMRIFRRPVVVAELVGGGSVPLGTFTAPAATSTAMSRIGRMVDELNAEREKLA